MCRNTSASNEFSARKKHRIDNKCSIVQTREENLVLMIPLLSARLLKIAALNKPVDAAFCQITGMSLKKLNFFTDTL